MPTSTFIRTKWIDITFKAVAAYNVAATWLSLHTSDPGPAGANEVVGSAYARQSSAWGTNTAGSIPNSGTITFPAVITTPYFVASFGVWDAATVGNLLAYGNVASPRTFNIGDIPTWLANSLFVTLI